ncbi:MAG: hypothetical protein ABIL15_06455 [candidate division WOR-3 bacterium]
MHPIWSPDGKFVAFNRIFQVMRDPPWIVDSLSGMRIIEPTKGSCVDSVISFFCIDWFPSGTEILSFTGGVYSLSTHCVHSLLDTSLHYIAADISPDGRNILCVKKNESVDSFMIVMIDTLGFRSKVLFNSGLAPSWHPSGDRLVFIGTLNNKKHICIGDTNGNIVRLIVPKGGDAIAWGGCGPRFSPDGSKICYSSYQYADGGLDDFFIHICDSLGKNDIELIDGYQPFWSPDGNKIVFARYNADEDATSLWIINSNGSGLKRITY